MAPDSEHRTVHGIDIAAPAGVVYDIVARPVRWPRYFAPTVHVERTGLDAGTERLRIWAMGDDRIKTWTSLRVLDEGHRVITFQQEVPAPPIKSMMGTWTVRDAGGGRARLTLTHEFGALGDDPRDLAWITSVAHANSETELGNVKQLAESRHRLRDLEFSFEDSVRVHGTTAAVYEFLRDAARWPKRLPHVADLKLSEDGDGAQIMSMWTRSRDGSTHETTSARVCFAGRRIVYKQLSPPALLAAHVGEWCVDPEGDGVRVTSRHTLRLAEDAVGTLPAAGTTIASTRDFVRTATSANSRATLGLAKEHAERLHADRTA